MALPDRIKEARIEKGMTQEQLAVAIGVAKSTMNGYENGNSEPKFEIISKIMSVLNVDANFLWRDEMDSLGGTSMDLSYEEMKHIRKYRLLDDFGRETVGIALSRETQRVQQIKELAREHKKDYLLPNAAHARTDIEISEEIDATDNDIMDNF